MGNKASRSTSATQLALDAILARPTALRADMFALASVAHHGVPSNAKTLAFCGRQGLLAVGTAGGAIKLYGADGLEVLLEAPIASSSVAAGVTHMQFTAHQRLVAAYTDSSVRIFDLTTGVVLAEMPASWTTSVIVWLETIAYTNFPFFFVATDDGEIHVIHEETGRVSTYVIRPQDLSVSNAEGVTALASHPRDSNQLLIAFDTCPAVLLWDFAKRKVIREFTLSGKARKAASPQASLSPPGSMSADADGNFSCNSPQSLAWHSSGKRFVAGFKQGGFAVFRADKPTGLYRCVAAPPGSSTDPITSVRQIQWVCAPPASRHAHLPGAILFSGGRANPEESNLLTLVYPPNDGRGGDDALVDLFKSEKLTWTVTTIESVNHAEISAFAVAKDQVDNCSKMAPLSVIVLSGNPLDGCLPAVSVQCLPCFVKLCDGDKEEWDWRLERLPEPAIAPPLLQLSPLKTFALINLSQPDSVLQDDLFSSWEQKKHDPMFRVLLKEDFEWPINGGSVLEPMLKGFLASSGALGSEMQMISQNSTMMLTGHANGYVLFWEIQPAADRSSKGALRLLHVIDAPLQMSPAPDSKEITCLTFCAEARVLAVGFVTGEVAVLEFGQSKHHPSSLLGEEHFSADGALAREGKGSDAAEPAGGGADKELTTVAAADLSADLLSRDSSQEISSAFRTLFSIHVHTEAISKLTLSSAYDYVAVADTGGMVSLVHLSTQAFRILVCDLAPASGEPMAVASLLMSELVQTTEIPGSSPPLGYSMPGDSGSGNGGKSSAGTARHISGTPSDGSDGTVMTLHREVIPVLFVGRGSGKLEMYHVHSATKMGETLVDPEKATSLSSVIMVDADGKQIAIPGRLWAEPGEGSADIESSSTPIDDSISSEMVAPNLTAAVTIEKRDDGGDQPPPHVRSPYSDFEYTKQVLLESVEERSESAAADTMMTQNETLSMEASMKAPSSVPSNTIEVVAPSGALGLHLFMDVEQRAMVKGFAEESSSAVLLEAKGVRAGHVITSINGVDLTSFDRNMVCAVLEKLRDREKVLTFSDGFELPMVNNRDIGGLREDADRPRFLVCTCGKTIHIVQATVPRAAEMAMGPKEIPAQPLASIELQATVLITSVVRVPIAERVENCLAVVDQSNRLYILSMLSLKVIWETDCFGFGFALGHSGLVDGILADISYGGELLVANTFGEMECFSLFAEPTAMESTMLERKSIKTRLYLPERSAAFDQATSPPASGGAKKRGIASDAGKMFKKLVLSVTHEATDLSKVFQFSTEEDERNRLLGDRAAVAKEATSADTDANSTAKVEHGANATKAALMQAQQVRIIDRGRGDKLNDLGLKTEQMKKTSEDFYQTMKAFNEKNANKKWYEF
ncbi:hypothetical protein BBJ28_00021480 [Nothophytophthora sp. Chile5]|nr:hypothetical protein BBJ28_00021480 [Nothophytophthora sp. Chile5]